MKGEVYISEDSIEVLETLERVMFCIITLLLIKSNVSDVVFIYLGKDKKGRYNFYDGRGYCWDI